MSAALVILPMVWATAAVPARSAKKLPETVGPETVGPEIVGPEIVEPSRTAPEVAFYRKYTEGLLRRYVRLSMEAGRAPSLLGREMFRGNVTNYSVQGFDDVVIFVHDVETCVKLLDEGRQHLVRRIALQEFTLEETASLLQLPLRTVHRRYGNALDELTEIFLERKLLEPSKGRPRGRNYSLTSPCFICSFFSFFLSSRWPVDLADWFFWTRSHDLKTGEWQIAALPLAFSAS